MAIKIKPSHKGKLHRKLGILQGRPIPPGKLAEALDSKSNELREEAQFAKNAKGWKHR
jgi:hypothetical protein